MWGNSVCVNSQRRIASKGDSEKLWVRTHLHLSRVGIFLQIVLELCFSKLKRRWPQSEFDSRQVKDFSSLHSAQTDSGPHPPSYPMGTVGDFPESKAPGSEADHSPPPSGEVKSGGAMRTLLYMYSWHDALLVKHRDSVLLSLLFPQGTSPRFPLNGRQDSSKSRSARCGETENLLSLPRNRPRFSDHPARNLVATQTELTRLLKTNLEIGKLVVALETLVLDVRSTAWQYE
jgi:hypothetical protein